jgi:putative Holliday junction resolvase
VVCTKQKDLKVASNLEQLNPESRVMGIDYGEKRIGIAISDPLKIFATPFNTLVNDNQSLQKLLLIIKEKNIIKIVLGLPSGKFKSSQLLSEKIHLFKKEIEAAIQVEIIFWDEEFSSVIAQEKVNESVTKKSSRRKKNLLDMHAAAIILQEYLNSTKS